VIDNRRPFSRAPLLAPIVGLLLIATAACGSSVDLSKGLEMTDVISGYYDDGLRNGTTHMVPTITFKLRNKIDKTIGPVQVSVAFWPTGADGEKDSVLVQAIGASGLPAGAATEPVLARSTVGFNVEGARADMFTNSQYVDFVAKVFASQHGSIYRLGEFTIERRLLPRVQKP
jgi:hypothetical protein